MSELHPIASYLVYYMSRVSVFQIITLTAIPSPAAEDYQALQDAAQDPKEQEAVAAEGAD